DEPRTSTVLLGDRRRKAEADETLKTKLEQGYEFMHKRIAEADAKRAEIAANQQQNTPYTGRRIITPSGVDVEPVGKPAHGQPPADPGRAGRQAVRSRGASSGGASAQSRCPAVAMDPKGDGAASAGQ